MVRKPLIYALFGGVVVVAILVTVTLVLVLRKEENGLELSVIHFNDFHARFEETNDQSNTCTNLTACIGGIARLYSAIKGIMTEKPDSILLNAGDNFQGTLWYNVFKWNVTQYFLNLLPSDVVTLGNHEFDDRIAGVVPFMKALTSPIVVSNIDDTLEPDLQGLYNKSTIIERNGKKIGVVGVILSTTNEIASTGNLKFLDESSSVNAEADRLVEEEGVFTVIVLSHCGYDIEKAIAQNATAKIGLVVGAHSHTFLYTGDDPPGPDTPYGDYPTVIEHESGRKVLVVQASAYTKYLGNITVFYDDEGEVSSWSGAPIFLEHEIEPDEEILALLPPWKEVVDVQGTVVIGETVNDLDYSGRYTKESTLGNFVTDAFIFAYQDQAEGNNWAYAGSAIINAGGLRASINAGNITYGEMVTAQPFENTVDIGELQGKYIKDLFEATTSEYDYGRQVVSVSLLQVSGIKLVYNISNPEGSRVVSIMMRCYECETPVYEDLDLDKMYRMIVPSFLVTGGDGYTVITDNIQNHKVGPVDIDVFVEYLKEKSPVNVTLEGRIEFVGSVEPTRRNVELV